MTHFFTRFRGLSGLLACALLAYPACLSAQQPPRTHTAATGTQPDFRKAVWGMTQAQVKATESIEPAETRQTGDEAVLKYDSPTSAKERARVIYIFAKDNLVRAKYIFDSDHDELNDFIVDYRAAEPRLREKYGKPASERAVWDNDEFQQERLPYLDQDRSLASDILPSDQYAGLSVSLGYLRLYTQWSTGRTRVVHALTGENSRITHQIEYRSIELEPFENQVLRQNTAGLR
jgi:hypothetical protein